MSRCSRLLVVFVLLNIGCSSKSNAEIIPSEYDAAAKIISDKLDVEEITNCASVFKPVADFWSTSKTFNEAEKPPQDSIYGLWTRSYFAETGEELVFDEIAKMASIPPMNMTDIMSDNVPDSVKNAAVICDAVMRNLPPEVISKDAQ